MRLGKILFFLYRSFSRTLSLIKDVKYTFTMKKFRKTYCNEPFIPFFGKS